MQERFLTPFPRRWNEWPARPIRTATSRPTSMTIWVGWSKRPTASTRKRALPPGWPVSGRSARPRAPRPPTAQAMAIMEPSWEALPTWPGRMAAAPCSSTARAARLAGQSGGTRHRGADHDLGLGQGGLHRRPAGHRGPRLCERSRHGRFFADLQRPVPGGKLGRHGPFGLGGHSGRRPGELGTVDRRGSNKGDGRVVGQSEIRNLGLVRQTRVPILWGRSSMR